MCNKTIISKNPQKTPTQTPTNKKKQQQKPQKQNATTRERKTLPVNVMEPDHPGGDMPKSRAANLGRLETLKMKETTR